MKFGVRRPSLHGALAARLSLKRYIRHSLGLKAPRGWGWLTDPRRALYNRVYHRTTRNVIEILKVELIPGRHQPPAKRCGQRSLDGEPLRCTAMCDACGIESSLYA